MCSCRPICCHDVLAPGWQLGGVGSFVGPMRLAGSGHSMRMQEYGCHASQVRQNGGLTCVQLDNELGNLVGRHSHGIDGRLGGQATAWRMSVPLDGAHARFGTRYRPLDTRLCGEMPDIQDHGLLGCAQCRGIVVYELTLHNACHSHTGSGCTHVDRYYASLDSCKGHEIVEPSVLAGKCIGFSMAQRCKAIAACLPKCLRT